MKLRNPLKLLTWNSLFRSSRGRRRRRPSHATVNVAAEVLEVRALLTAANVAATVVGTALTLTSDNNGNHSVNVYRLDATHVEIDASAVGTTINGGASAVFALSSVSGITVNVGSGYDSYNIFSKAGDPALNVGAGGILFQGAGGTGDNLEVYNDSTNAMTILGNVTVQGSTLGSALCESGSSASYFYLYTENSGSLAVDGSVSASQRGTGLGGQYNEIYTEASGNLSVAGGITQTATSPGYVENEVFAESTGNLTVGGSIIETATATGGSSGAENYVYNESSGCFKIGTQIVQTATGRDLNNYVYNESNGTLAVGLSITQNATATSGSVDDYVYDESSGSFQIGPGGITINESNSAATGDDYNQVYTQSTGALSTTGLIAINAANSTAAAYFTQNYVDTEGSSGGTLSALGVVIIDSGSETQYNYVYSDGAAIAIGPVGITIIGSGSGYHNNEIDTDANSSPITIAGSVTVIDTGTGHSTFKIEADDTNSPITICGSVVYENLNTVGHSLVDIFGSIDDTNSLLTIKGSLLVTLAQTSGTAGDNQSFTDNEVDLGRNEGTSGLGYGTIVNGVTSITGSNGQDKIYIKQAQLGLGAILNTLGNPTPGASWHDELEIDGSSFGSTVLVTMTGPNAEIDVNNGNGNQPTVFGGLFEAIMLGSNSRIFVADGSGTGYGAVKFSAVAIAVGNAGLGDTFTYQTANVTGTIVPLGLTLVAL